MGGSPTVNNAEMVYEWIPMGYYNSFALTELSGTSIPLNHLLVHGKATFHQQIGRLSRSLASHACAQRPAGTISPLPHTEGCCPGIPLPGPRLWGGGSCVIPVASFLCSFFFVFFFFFFFGCLFVFFSFFCVFLSFFLGGGVFFQIATVMLLLMQVVAPDFFWYCRRTFTAATCFY